MNATLLTIVAGLAVGAGCYLLIRQLLPSRPALQPALERLNSAPTPTPDLPLGAPLEQRLGARAQPLLEGRIAALTLTKTADLAMVGKARSTLLGERLIASAAGLVVAPIAGLVLTLGGAGVGYLLPGAASLVLGALGWLLPDLLLRDQASKARVEAAAAASAFMDLVAIARTAGDAANEAMVRSARISGNATFHRIAEVLQQAAWSGITPSQALLELRDEWAVPELGDIADIMRLTSAGGQVIETLRERARTLRDAQLAAEQAEANQQSERLTAAMTLTGVVFLLMMLYPAAVAML